MASRFIDLLHHASARGMQVVKTFDNNIYTPSCLTAFINFILDGNFVHSIRACIG